MFTNTDWKGYTPSKRMGKICYHYCSGHSHLPVRDILNSHRQGFKLEPNYETATYNWCARCNQPSVKAAVKNGLSHILFITRYKGKNAQYRDEAAIVGYYEIGEVAVSNEQMAVRAKKMCFVPIEKAYRYPVDNLRWATQRITGTLLEEILSQLDAYNDTEQYLYEASRLKAEYNPYSTVPSGRIFVINVGANITSPLQSPLFDDGRFEFVPIPEHHTSYSDEFLTFGDLRQFYAPQRSLTELFPETLVDSKIKVHNDPEFATFTYGDNIKQKRPLSLLREGDFLFFLARLVPYDGRFYHNKAIFALIGYLEIAERIDSIEEIGPAFSQNAHVLRWKVDPANFDEFIIFKGSANSRRFRYAVPFDKSFVEEVPILAANNQPWKWERTTELGVIGSYTRAVRMHIDPSHDRDKERSDRFWQRVWQQQKWDQRPQLLVRPNHC
jgi:hypothetical protein